MKTSVLRQALLAWFAAHQQPLPWRRDYQPYQIWVSEVMLQQTRMERVVRCFDRWLERFPDIAELARAEEDEVLRFWEGLGYYRRARNLHRAAQMLMAEHQGRLPEQPAALRRLPGIGPYTANAILSLAFEQDRPVVDANVERLLARLFNIATPIKSRESREKIHQLAGELLPRGKARLFNQALMELGRLLCRPRTPDCGQCPVRRHCQAFRLGVVASRPVTAPRPATVQVRMATGILVHQGRVFVQKRLANDVWANLWEFPGGRIEAGESPEQAMIREYREETALEVECLDKIAVVHHSYSRYRVTLHGFFCQCMGEPGRIEVRAAQKYRWLAPKELDSLAFPAGHRQLIAMAAGEIANRCAVGKP